MHGSSTSGTDSDSDDSSHSSRLRQVLVDHIDKEAAAQEDMDGEYDMV